MIAIVRCNLLLPAMCSHSCEISTAAALSHLVVTTVVRCRQGSAADGSGTPFNKQSCIRKYFSDLMKSLEEVPESVKLTAHESRLHGDFSPPRSSSSKDCYRNLVGATRRTLMSIRGGPITALTGAGDRRSAPLGLHCGCSQLLRLKRSFAFCRQTTTWSIPNSAMLAAAG